MTHLLWASSKINSFSFLLGVEYAMHYMQEVLNQPVLLALSVAAAKYSVSDSEDEFDDWSKKDAPKRKAVISDDDTSFAPDPSTVPDSDMDSPAPPPKVPAPA